jgi:serine/threonine protein kinase
MYAPGALVDDRYEIVGLLAAGGMGEVYRARRTLLGDEVALKVIKTEGADPVVRRERFMRESRACAQLRHPHIVSILDFNIDAEGRPFLVMEYLNGPSLAQELVESGSMDLARVMRVVQPIASALQLAHDRGTLHRDLKPANIVSHRFESGEIIHKIVDFGLATLKTPDDETRITAANQFLGTVVYASPEQLRGESLDPRSDIYSLGVVVFELLTGRLPFRAETSLGIATQHLTQRPPVPSHVMPGLPGWVDSIVLKALAKKPSERWQSVREFAAALAGPSAETVVSGAAPALAPSLLGRYDVGARIGQGRLGSEVFAGVHRALGHPVAIRTLRRSGGGNWEAIRTRFLREARTLQLAHPSIIQVRDFGEDEDAVYVVTDLIESVSLRELLDREGPLAWPRVRRFVQQIAGAAAALHRRGGLISGVSPQIIRLTQDEEGERLMISSGGVCEVQDLLATASEQTLRGASLSDAELLYVPSEVLLGRPPDVRSDVYSIGVIAYEMATGRTPFTAASLPALMGAAVTGAVDGAGLRARMPAAAADAIVRALDRDPDKRFQSAGAFLAAWSATPSIHPDEPAV